ncbi:MAG: DUF655 domain-containing protein [Thermoproteota archaeon]
MKPPRQRPRPKHYEEYAYVLDFMPAGNPSDRHPRHRSGPVAQLVGEDYFTLMEGVPRPGVVLEVGERVYVGPVVELRDKIVRVEANIGFDELTSLARSTLEQVVESIVKRRERVFVEFFNIAAPINIRYHTLELLPGVGRKTVMRILELRERKRFESFEEIKKSVHIDPVKVIVARIVEELKGGQKYYLFVKPPRGEMEQPIKPVFFDYLTLIYQRLGRSSLEHEGPAKQA